MPASRYAISRETISCLCRAKTLGLEYYADRDTVLFGKYAHVNFDGVGVPNDYTGDEIHLGVRLRR